MLKFLLASSAIATVLVLSQPAKAIVINLPDNPTSQTGNFTSAPGAAGFEDQIVFNLTGGPQFVTIANATNTFANPATDPIAFWNAAIWSAGIDGIVNNGDDVLLFGPQFASPCVGVPNCRAVGGSGTIQSPGTYYAEFQGIGSGTSGYGGNISTFAVPAPSMGGGLPGLVTAFGGWFGWRRWRKT